MYNIKSNYINRRWAVKASVVDDVARLYWLKISC